VYLVYLLNVVSFIVTETGIVHESSMPEDVVATALELQEKCEAHRVERFDHGEAILRTFSLMEGGEGVLEEKELYAQRIWFSGDCLRNDYLAGPSKSRVAICNGQYIWDSGISVPVVVAPVAEYPAIHEQFGLAHIRWVGMGYNSPTSMSSGRESRCLMLLEKSNHNGVTLEKVIIDHVDAWKICYKQTGKLNFSGLENLRKSSDSTAADNTQFTGSDETSEPVAIKPSVPTSFELENTFWISPSQGYSLLRNDYRMSFPEIGVENLHNLHAEYTEDSNTKTWYPKAVTTFVRSNGKLVSGRKYKLENVVFARPDPAVFTLQGFALPVDTRISNRALGEYQKEFIWDGKKPVLIPDVEDLIEERSAESHGARSFWLIGNGVLLLAVAAWFAVRQRKEHIRKGDIVLICKVECPFINFFANRRRSSPNSEETIDRKIV